MAVFFFPLTLRESETRTGFVEPGHAAQKESNQREEGSEKKGVVFEKEASELCFKLRAKKSKNVLETECFEMQ